MPLEAFCLTLLSLLTAWSRAFLTLVELCSSNGHIGHTLMSQFSCFTFRRKGTVLYA